MNDVSYSDDPRAARSREAMQRHTSNDVMMCLMRV